MTTAADGHACRVWRELQGGALWVVLCSGWCAVGTKAGMPALVPVHAASCWWHILDEAVVGSVCVALYIWVQLLCQLVMHQHVTVMVLVVAARAAIP